VRVCDKCYDDLRATLGFGDIPAKSERETPAQTTVDSDTKAESSEKPTAQSSSSSSRVAETEDVADDEGSSEAASSGEKKETRKRVANCKCKMPLCICPADPETEEEREEREKKEGKSNKKVERKKAPQSTSPTSKAPAPSGFQPTFIGFGQKVTRQYDLKGDLNNQCREAVKSQDIDGVKMLLKAGAKADYKDRTGNTLLHLAAMFDNTELVKVLIAAGADPWVQNPGKESPIDIAPPALAAKMKSLAPKKEQSAPS